MTELPSGWVQTTLGEIAETRLGKMLSAKARGGADPRPYLRNKNVQWGRLDLDDLLEMDFSEEELDRFRVLVGDLLVCEGGDVGRAAIWRGSLEWIGYQKALHRVRPFGGVSPEYLLYGFMWLAQKRAFDPHVTGSTIKHLPQEDLRLLSIPLPPLNEQRRIVAAIEEHLSRLDAADAILAGAHRRLRILERVSMRQLLDGGWQTRSLAHLTVRITKGTTPTSLGRPFTPDGVLFVKAESLSDGVIDHDKCARIDRETHEVLARSQLDDGDVLVTIAGTLGRVAIVRARDVPANTNQAVSIVRLSDPDYAPWVATWLRNSESLLRAGGRGVGLQNLNLKQVAAVEVPVPPLNEQKRIVAEVEARLSALDALRASIERAQQRSRALRAAVLAKAFRGELVPHDPADEPADRLLARIRAEREGEPTPRRTPRKKVASED
jgi:type I restriction enzyme, S subunit